MVVRQHVELDVFLHVKVVVEKTVIVIVLDVLEPAGTDVLGVMDVLVLVVELVLENVVKTARVDVLVDVLDVILDVKEIVMDVLDVLDVLNIVMASV